MYFLIINDMDNMEGHRSLFKQQQLLASAVSLTALGAQFVTSLFMASSQQEKASWNDEETQALVDYLWEHRAESGDGGTFKDAVFNTIPVRGYQISSGPLTPLYVPPHRRRLRISEPSPDLPTTQ